MIDNHAGIFCVLCYFLRPDNIQPAEYILNGSGICADHLEEAGPSNLPLHFTDLLREATRDH